MSMSTLKNKLQEHPKLKKFLLNAVMHPVKTRPRRWIRWLQFLYLERGKGSVLYRSIRKDLVPFNRFVLGRNSVVEDFSTLNNAVGDIIIGDNCRIGLSNTVIGPIYIANGVNTSQNVVLIGLNHNYQDIRQPLIPQGVTTAPITIEEDTSIGANTVILPGVTIGKHCFIGAGCVVTKDIPSYSVTVGNPARVIKRYDFEQQAWVKVTSEKS